MIRQQFDGGATEADGKASARSVSMPLELQIIITVQELI